MDLLSCMFRLLNKNRDITFTPCHYTDTLKLELRIGDYHVCSIVSANDLRLNTEELIVRHLLQMDREMDFYLDKYEIEWVWVDHEEGTRLANDDSVEIMKESNRDENGVYYLIRRLKGE